MTTAEELAAFYASNSLGTVKTSSNSGTIYRNYMPDTPSDVLVLIEEVGMPGAQFIHDTGGVVSVEMPRITTIARSTDADVARALIEQAFLVAGTITNMVITVGGVFWWRCQPLTSPYLEGRDYNGWFRFAFRAQITKLISNS